MNKRDKNQTTEIKKMQPQNAQRESLEGDSAESANPSVSSAVTDLPKGVILKRAREEQGLSLDTVHESTKIPMDFLRAIEEGYTIRTLSPFYYRGFLKIYSKYLNLDVSEVVEGVRGEEPQNKETDIERLDSFDLQKLYSRIIRFFSPKRKRQTAKLIGAIIIIYLVGQAATMIRNRPQKPTKSNPVTVKEKTQRKKDRPRAVRSVVSQPPRSVIKPTVNQQQSVTKSEQESKLAVSSVTTTVVSAVTLSVRAKKKSWLRVKTDGNVVFQSALAAGAVETWRADDQIEISGRNINQLEFELNGKMIGELGRKDRGAKKVIVTKDGLKVTN